MAICRTISRGLLLALALAAACTSGEPIAGLGPATTGSLAVGISGLPSGSPASVSITNSQGFQRTVTSTQMVVGLTPGTYTVTATDQSANGDAYSATPTTQSVAVSAGATPATVIVAYVLVTGRLTVTISGVPAGTTGAVTISGPAGYAHQGGATETLVGLAPGLYTVQASSVVINGNRYDAPVASQDVSVAANPGVTAQAAVGYVVTSGSLSISVAGLPAGVGANVSVTGPQGFTAAVTASTTLTGLVPGAYQITASDTVIGGTTYLVTPPSQTATVVAGLSPEFRTVVYTQPTGSLVLTLSGLPGGVPANVTVTGPGGYNHAFTVSQTVSGLAPGSYTVSAVAVVTGPTVYNASPLTQTVGVTGGGSVTASVSYTTAGSTAFNLTIGAVYLTQATQRLDGSVPLVAGRNAYLRVFALASQSNTAQPQVRVRLYNGAALLQTYTIAAPVAGVPQSANEGSLAGSWNVVVPGALIQPNLKVLADVDPAQAIFEGDETDNMFPISGVPAAVDVRALPTFQVRLVPVLQQANGLQGNVTVGNAESFLADLKQKLPVGAYDADVRAPYTTTAPVLQNDNANGAWATILSEVLALKSTDASTRYYYGVVRTSYGSGVAGMGYVGGSARTAIGWDYLPSGSGIMAHEVGHNMSRQHAPCGSPSSPDPAFPYAGGKIGVWGFDLSTLTLKSPTTFSDLMGYCSPDWVSDYNWSAMVAYRQGGPNNAPAVVAGDVPGLLVWGRIGSTGIVLEPAFTLTGASGRAPAPGPNRLELLAADGSVLRTVAFDAEAVADLPGSDERHFAFVIPMDTGLDRAVAGLRVRAGGQVAAWTADPSSPPPVVDLARAGPDQVQLHWDAARFPMVMVREAATGAILSFARGGSARVWTRGSDFVLQYSTGVSSVSRSARILK